MCEIFVDRKWAGAILRKSKGAKAPVQFHLYTTANLSHPGLPPPTPDVLSPWVNAGNPPASSVPDSEHAELLKGNARELKATAKDFQESLRSQSGVRATPNL